MKPENISIIGGRGKMGSLFAKNFYEQGYRVLVSDENNSNNAELAQKGEVVMVAVPIEKTEEVIMEIGPYVRKEALLTDLTSVKMKPVAAMTKYSPAEVIGGHPLFGPNAELQNQKMILCPSRDGIYKSWYENTLESWGIKPIIMNAEEHDKTMAVVQCLNHFSNLAFAYALTTMNQKLSQQDITTPAYLLRLCASARMLSQDPSLYSGMFLENPFAKDAVRAYVDAVTEVSAMVQGSEKKELEELLHSLQEKFQKGREKR